MENIDVFVENEIAGLDIEEFRTAAFIGPSEEQMKQAAITQKMTAVEQRRAATRQVEEEEERLRIEAEEYESLIPGLQAAGAEDPAMARYLFEAVPGLRDSYTEMVTGREAGALAGIDEEMMRWARAGHAATKRLEQAKLELAEAQGPPSIPGVAGISAPSFVPALEREIKQLENTIRIYGNLGGLRAQTEATAIRREAADRPDFEAYVTGQIPGLQEQFRQSPAGIAALERRTATTERQEAREAADIREEQRKRELILTRPLPGIQRRSRQRY